MNNVSIELLDALDPVILVCWAQQPLEKRNRFVYTAYIQLIIECHSAIDPSLAEYAASRSA
ncbi:MAG: hypothetical protein DHS20C20_03540 [Ardenticatenaceae bacterium]|nr:MAG: hypothetical protein DHS20C20_03540 [Ardenticatenaceae bacterium]